ncbi:MAG: response regulator [Nitrososphaerales archaeon]
MLVDDEPDLLAMTKEVLESSGYEVHAFSSPDGALLHTREKGCKDCMLLVSDIRMAGMSGFELVRQMKQLRPELKVVLMSSFVIHKGEFEKVMPSFQIDDFVKKPFTKAEIVEAIRRVAKDK